MVDIKLIPFSFPSIPKVYCVFQTRSLEVGYGQNFLKGNLEDDYSGGNISYATNDRFENVFAYRKILKNKIGYNFSELYQVHGDNIIFHPECTALDDNIQKNIALHADGQATSEKGIALMIKTADCQPILIAHKNGNYIMALHVGWRGNKINFIFSIG